MSQRRPFRARWLLLALGGIGGLLVAEGLMELFLPQMTISRAREHLPACFRESSVHWFGLLPGARTSINTEEFQHAVVINQQGLRMDRSVREEGPSGGRRISILGDSFAFGWGVAASESFPSVLERSLRKDDPHLEVVNYGFALGPAPDAYYAALRARPTFETDVVVVSLFVGNDLTTPEFMDWHELDERGLPARVSSDVSRVDSDHRLVHGQTPWRYRTPVLRDSNLWIALTGLLAAKKGDTDDGALTERLKEEHPGRSITDGRLYTKQWPTWLKRSVAKSVLAIVGLAELAADKGQEFLVMVIPHPNQVVAPPGRARLSNEPQERLARALGRQGVRYMDLLPVLLKREERREGVEPPLFYPRDGHFTAAGHAVAADALAAELERLGWLD